LQDLGYAGTAKIADVGLARIMQHTMSNTATGDPAGTFAYAAPEMLMGEKWDDKVGCCLSVCMSVCLCQSDSPVVLCVWLLDHAMQLLSFGLLCSQPSALSWCCMLIGANVKNLGNVQCI